VTTLETYLDNFDEEPGYLDFARVGPLSRSVVAEEMAMSHLLARGRYGTIGTFEQQDSRLRDAVAALTGFRADQVVFEPNTSQGLLHSVFGLQGTLALSAAEFPSLPFAAVRANDALGTLTPRWIDTVDGRVTPDSVRAALTDEVTAVAVSLVDFRSGFRADLEGIREVIGERLLIVDAIQGFGVVEAPYQVADVVASGGQKWMRAGWGTGFLALSDRAVERIAPLLSGFSATGLEGTPVDEVLAAGAGAVGFQISRPDPIAQARFATALEDLAGVGVPVVGERIAERVSRIIDLADEFAITVSSPRDESNRAGIVVLEPEQNTVTALVASLHNHGVSATTRGSSVRLSPHVSTSEDTLAMLKGALMSFASALTG